VTVPCEIRQHFRCNKAPFIAKNARLPAGPSPQAPPNDGDENHIQSHILLDRRFKERNMLLSPDGSDGLGRSVQIAETSLASRHGPDPNLVNSVDISP